MTNPLTGRILKALRDYPLPLTAAGIADELDIPTHNLPVHQMCRDGLIEVAGVIDGYCSWELTEKGKEQAK